MALVYGEARSSSSLSVASTQQHVSATMPDWESLTDIDFDRVLSNLQTTSTALDRTRFSSQEEYEAFRKRRLKYLTCLSDELSNLYKEVDLVSMMRQQKDISSGESLAIASFEGGLSFPSYVEEKQDTSMKQRRSK